MKTLIKSVKLTGDGRFCPGNSNLMESELNDNKNTKGMGMTQLVCGLHGHNSVKVTGWERMINDLHCCQWWDKQIKWDSKPRRQCKINVSTIFL